MNRVATYALTLALCTSVSPFAFAQTPPASYKPSVPARMTEREAAEAAQKDAAMATQTAPVEQTAPAESRTDLTAPPKTYRPSVPARKTESEMAKPAAAAPEAPITTTTQEIRKQPVKAPENIGKAVTSEGLAQALAKAYNFNPELKSFRSRLKAVDEQVPQARSGWLPSLSATYSRGKENETIGNGAEVNLSPQTKALTVNQPLFRGGETLARTDRALNAVEVARAELTDAEQQILLNAVRAYIEVVRSTKVLELSTNNEQVLKEQLEATNERFKLGETTRTDVAQSEARLARATSDKVRAKGDLDVARANYVRIIGEEPKKASMPAKLPPLPESLEQALAVGLEQNPSLKAAEFNQQIADSDIDIAFASLLPDADLRGSLTRQKDASSTLRSDIDNDSVTVNVSIPLYQSGAEYSRIRQSKRTKEQRREQYEDTHNRTVESITRTWRDIETARASIKANKATVEGAEVALEGVRQEAEVGSRTTLDVLDAEQELFIARVNLVAAQASEVNAVHAHLAAIGYLTAGVLGLNVELYNPLEHYKDVRYQIIGW